jgi:EAL domain
VHRDQRLHGGLRDKYFVGSVHEVLAETGLESGRVELELTETFLMENSQATATVLEALRDMGVRIALDDFGTGYSSLSYLKRFPIDTLKIDRSFVCNIATDPDDACIVSAVIGMGKGLRPQRARVRGSPGLIDHTAALPEVFPNRSRRVSSAIQTSASDLSACRADASPAARSSACAAVSTSVASNVVAAPRTS